MTSIGVGARDALGVIGVIGGCRRDLSRAIRSSWVFCEWQFAHSACALLRLLSPPKCRGVT
jgi:hypothetical protein